MYKQDSPTGWRNGVTTCVGVKAMVESFHADLHQRLQEMTVVDAESGSSKTILHKPFYAAEVDIAGLELRAVSAAFAEPQKALVPVDADDEEETEPLPDSSCEDMSSKWVDMDDYPETDWMPQDDEPRLWLLPSGSCPKFTYFKRSSVNPPLSGDDCTGATLVDADLETSKFGNEDTHVCFQGVEDCSYQYPTPLPFARY